MLALERPHSPTRLRAGTGPLYDPGLGLTPGERDVLVVRLVEQIGTLSPSDLADVLSAFGRDEREQLVATLIGAGADPRKVADAVSELEQRRIFDRKRQFRAVLWSVALASGGLSAYHGYRRNEHVGWALWWFAMGTLFPVITPAVAFGQGFAQPKALRQRPVLDAALQPALHGDRPQTRRRRRPPQPRPRSRSLE